MSQQRSLAAYIAKNGKILLGRRNNVGDMGGRWELPGGKAELSETDQEALTRELKEELSVEATILDQIEADKFIHDGREHLLFVYAVTIECEPTILSEHQQVAWFSLNALPNPSDLVDSDARVLAKIAAKYQNPC